MGQGAEMGGGEPVNIPTEALPLLLMQRTRLQGELAERYYEACAEDFATIRDYLPDGCHRILDIGCGVGGLDVLLARHLCGDGHFYLLDHDRVDDLVYYGFADSAPAYNSLALTKATLEANGVDREAVTLLEAGKAYTGPGESLWRFRLPEQVDLVLSVRSWGYHYPVHEYLDDVWRVLRDDARLILDVRKRTGGMKALKRHPWANVEVIYEESKLRRVMCEMAT